MPATWELLEETDARQKLETFIGNVASAGEVGSWDNFLEVVGETQLPIAVRSLITHRGQPNPDKLGEFRTINGSNAGWNLLAYNNDFLHHSSASIVRTRRKLLRRHERDYVSFYDPDITKASAGEISSRSMNHYLVASCQPGFFDGAHKAIDGSPPSELDHDVVSSFMTTAVEAKLKAPETLSGFLRISSRLVGDLLAVTTELKSTQPVQ